MLSIEVQTISSLIYSITKYINALHFGFLYILYILTYISSYDWTYSLIKPSGCGVLLDISINMVVQLSLVVEPFPKYFLLVAVSYRYLECRQSDNPNISLYFLPESTNSLTFHIEYKKYFGIWLRIVSILNLFTISPELPFALK